VQQQGRKQRALRRTTQREGLPLADGFESSGTRTVMRFRTTNQEPLESGP
jgi:hypothetical protein